jgi:hypothetical protein
MLKSNTNDRAIAARRGGVHPENPQFICIQ